MPGSMSAPIALDRMPASGAGQAAAGALPAAAPLNGAPQGAERRTHLEVQLTDIWLELLKLPHIGLHDDFFDLGGDSLLATEMFHRVEQDCGCRVDPSRVLTSLTIRRMAMEILQGSRDTLANPVVQIQEGSSRAPFFFLHNDAQSGGFYCRRIARALGPDVTMFAVQPHGLNGTPFLDSIEDMAADRVQSILRVRPAGPYRIGGFCGGGVVAYEVARQLVARGEQVEHLLLIDTVAPNLDVRSSWMKVRRVAAILGLSPARQRAVIRRLKWYHEDLRASGRAGLAGWSALLWAKLKSAVTRAVTGSAESAAAPDPGTDDLRTALWRQFTQRSSVYVPEDFPGRLALFRSTYLDSPRAKDTEARWRLLTAAMDVHHVPGDHFTCVTTHAPALAQSMRPYLRD